MIYLLILALSAPIFAAEPGKPPVSAKVVPEKTPVPVKQETAPAAMEMAKADVYDLEGKEKLYTYESDRNYTANTMKFSAKFKNLQGEVIAEESAEITDGVIIRYQAERKETREKGTIESRDGRIFFNYTEKNSKSAQKYEKMQPDTLVSANLVPFLESRWTDLMAKKEVPFRYAVWFRQETIGFKFAHEKEAGDLVTFSMSPTNFIYRSLVNPVHFEYNKTTKKLLSIKGRTMPRIKKDNAWRDLDALVKFN